MKRLGQVIKVKPEYLERYKELYAHPCQEAVDSAAPGEWWADMEEVYHLEESEEGK